MDADKAASIAYFANFDYDGYEVYRYIHTTHPYINFNTGPSLGTTTRRRHNKKNHIIFSAKFCQYLHYLHILDNFLPFGFGATQK